jgi:glycosyltransferase involved in cell wall biosynthesis
MENNKYQFTVFTPCYNSAHTIHRVIESLDAQTFRDFEWIIVDDGSSDNLYEKIKPLIDEKRFPVKYFRRDENQGKPAAINLGVSTAEGAFFQIIDADDSFTPDALEVLNDSYQALPEDIKPEISGVTAHCRDQYGNFLGTPYPPADGYNPLICSVFDMRYKYKVEGEKWGFTKTAVMKEFPFNTEADKFVTENTVWFAIAAKYKAAFINKTLRIYYLHD